MSISSHLSPDPERRLWVIHDGVRRAVESADMKLGLLALLSVIELSGLPALSAGGAAPSAAAALLCAALVLALAALSPASSLDRQIPLLDPHVGKVRPDDSLVRADDLARSAHAELVFHMDRYLGGGITAIKFYEDIVARIIRVSRAAVRKRRLFLVSCAAAIAAQLFLAAGLFLR